MTRTTGERYTSSEMARYRRWWHNASETVGVEKEWDEDRQQWHIATYTGDLAGAPECVDEVWRTGELAADTAFDAMVATARQHEPAGADTKLENARKEMAIVLKQIARLESLKAPRFTDIADLSMFRETYIALEAYVRRAS